MNDDIILMMEKSEISIKRNALQQDLKIILPLAATVVSHQLI
jgi:hypothetical protein